MVVIIVRVMFVLFDVVLMMVFLGLSRFCVLVFSMIVSVSWFLIELLGLNVLILVYRVMWLGVR